MKGKKVALALGSGGARGYAHIGVIEELEKRGAEIISIAGSSMGATVGGIYAAGKMPEFKDWSLKLTRMETMRLMDFTFSGQGMIKGDKILTTLRDLLGDLMIEDFKIAYTAVATDFISQSEVEMRSGNLYEVIRASSAIPTFFTPVKKDGKILFDGGVLNPLPLSALNTEGADIVIAVNINAPGEGRKRKRIEDPESDGKLMIEAAESQGIQSYKDIMVSSVRKWLNMTKTEQNSTENEKSLGYLGMLNKSYDLMQDKIGLMNIEIYKPDIVVNVPRSFASTLEVYRAQDLIDEGRRSAVKAFKQYTK